MVDEEKKEKDKVSYEHIPTSPVLAPQIPAEVTQEHTGEKEKEETPTHAQVESETYTEEDMDLGVIVSYEHIPSAPVLAQEIPTENNKIESLKAVCEGSSTVPPADAESERAENRWGCPCWTTPELKKQKWVWMQEKPNTAV